MVASWANRPNLNSKRGEISEKSDTHLDENKCRKCVNKIKNIAQKQKRGDKDCIIIVLKPQAYSKSCSVLTSVICFISVCCVSDEYSRL